MYQIARVPKLVLPLVLSRFCYFIVLLFRSKDSVAILAEASVYLAAVQQHGSTERFSVAESRRFSEVDPQNYSGHRRSEVDKQDCPER